MKKIIIITGIFMFIALEVTAQELRPFNPIRTQASITGTLLPGAQVVEPTKPLPDKVISSSADTIASSWNTLDFQKMVSDRFYNRSRLIDAMNTETAKDAKLKVLNTHSANIISQAIVPDSDGGKLRVSTVSIVMETRAEFNDPKQGFISAPGTNEMLIEVVEKIE
ncbi:MAG: hypothetical protein N3D15_03695 [Syntrophorhabdaceae bacterium]|nr:hypothetical protein [Syntrophorhabdaceae bacterium]